MYKSKHKKTSSKIAKRRQMKETFGLILKISLPVAVLVSLVFLLRANFLQIKNFEVMGAETISAENLKNIARSRTSGNKLFFIPKTNIFLLNKNNLANVLLADFARIEKVEVNKEFLSQSIELKIKERKSDFLWCSENDECFNMTKDGLVFASPDIAFVESSKVVFRGVLIGNPIMKNFATTEKMQDYLSLINTFKNEGFEISSINIESSDKAVAEIKINNYKSKIIFSPQEKNLSVIAQNALLLINETKSKNPKSSFQYIDTRFGNKLFYKLI